MGEMICERNSKPLPHYCKELLCDGKKYKQFGDRTLCEYTDAARKHFYDYAKVEPKGTA